MFSTPFAILSSLVFTEMSYFMRGCLRSGSDSGLVAPEESDSSAVSSQVRSMLALQNIIKPMKHKVFGNY